MSLIDPVIQHIRGDALGRSEDLSPSYFGPSSKPMRTKLHLYIKMKLKTMKSFRLPQVL